MKEDTLSYASYYGSRMLHVCAVLGSCYASTAATFALESQDPEHSEAPNGKPVI